MKKQELREIYKQKRNDLTETQIQEFQENIYEQIYDLEIVGVKNVHLFLSLTKFNEIDTQPIIDYFRSIKKRIVVSKCNFKDNTLTHFYLEHDTVLELNKFGVPEPVNAEQVDETALDLVFVPLLISDELNYRVGYGKGYYDRFLSKCKEEATFIGINFFKPIYQIEDSNEFDIPLHQVIYPK
ncbi:5-formyltetrahydrofolate cyclo-ligase [Polaribacter undariae]|uniref:5-formyltetrahydrofolate cyclo-ligase n=1 Tax=Polaribacter sejongensis TaxID=985043 RepID=A0AAJ1VFE7_9FLAO|nr:5-formyltetrahydrofolate cyclo-ligase [Polaribacter undariae]MDN3618596.1 5-formyltetrahydrofolate cyclo-ligase [Polaribacter undariae]UWD30423.1 5-formyltetrahydrofolate cyclo-ligase [Polaribacter undariae]